MRILVGRVGMLLIATLGVGCFGSSQPGPNEQGKSSEPITTRPIDVWDREDDPARRFALLFPPGKVKADVLQIAASPRIIEIADKLKKAAQDNPGPWLARVLSGKPGQAVPYDKKMGITEEEYKEFLSSNGSGKMVLLQTGAADLTISRGQNGEILIQGFPGVDEFQLIPDKMTIKTPQGSVSQPSEFKPNENQKLTGPIQGYSWNSGFAGLFGGHILRYTVAQQKETGAVLLEIRIKDVLDGKYLADYMVRFPGPRE